MMRLIACFLLLALSGSVSARPAPLAERLVSRQPFFRAHRGWTAEAPENSVPSFTRAGELGFQAIETDVRRTKDGVLVCVHDAFLKRTFGVDMCVADIAVLSSCDTEHIRAARRLNPRIFVHHIFTRLELLDKIAAMGNAGVSFNYRDPSKAPPELLARAEARGEVLSSRDGFADAFPAA